MNRSHEFRDANAKIVDHPHAFHYVGGIPYRRGPIDQPLDGLFDVDTLRKHHGVVLGQIDSAIHQSISSKLIMLLINLSTVGANELPGKVANWGLFDSATKSRQNKKSKVPSCPTSSRGESRMMSDSGQGRSLRAAT